MVRLTEKEWLDFKEKTGYTDQVIPVQEVERKKKIDLEILLAVGAVQDRQALEYWRGLNQARLQKEREAEEDRIDARVRQRKINRQGSRSAA